MSTPRGPPPRSPPPRPGGSPRGPPRPPGSVPSPRPGMSPRGPPGMSPRGPPGVSPRGPPGMSPRGPPPRGAPRPGGMSPRGPPPGMSPSARGPPPRAGAITGLPPRGGPPTPQGYGQAPGNPPTNLPRGPLPRGAPPPRMLSDGQNRPQGGQGPPPRGMPSGPPKGPNPIGIPPKGPEGGVAPPPRMNFKPPPGAPPKVGPPNPPQQPRFGKLTVKCNKGIDLKAGQGIFGKANPYTKLKIGSQEFQTAVHREGGKNPVWNEEFTFEITLEKELELEIYDKDDNGTDKYMGGAKPSLVDWIGLGKWGGDVDIQDKNGKNVGAISLLVEFSRPSGQQQQAPTGAGGLGQQQQAPMQQQAADGSEPVRDPNGKFTDQEIYEAFVAFDLDKNNFVGAAEIRHVLINIGETVTDEEVDEMIRMVDKDGDGQVSFDEFYGMVTGGRKPPPGLGGGGKAGAAGKSKAPPPPTGQSVVQARTNKKTTLEEFSKDHNIKAETVKKAFKRYQTSNKDKSGMIDYTEFCEILQLDPSPLGEKTFQLFDYEKSGQIDTREFLIALQNFTGASKDDRLKFAFMLFDEDGNGVLTMEELTKILKANHMASSNAEVGRKAETVMSQADKDGDGVVTFDEFVIVSKKFPNIVLPSYASED